MRRSQPSAEEEEADGDDDSKKTRKSARASRGHYCLVVSLILSIAVVVLAFVLVSRFRSFVCISPPHDSYSQTALFGSLDGLASDFGCLGVPWCRSKHGKVVEWTRKDLLKGLEEFVPIYESRPIKNDMNGMGFDHSFGLWFIARWLKPELMIESGTFMGHSTWILRQAMSETPIISLSPHHPEKYPVKVLSYVDKNCTYFAGKDYVDFGSVDWGRVVKEHGISDSSRVLVFFDDHQNELKRVTEALNAGFSNLIFEDNYDTGTGDHYSLRQICDQLYIRGGGHSCFRDSDEARIRAKRKGLWDKALSTDELCGKGEAWWGVRGEMLDNLGHANRPISYSDHFRNSRFLESVLDLYWELPPVAGPSLTHQTNYDPARAPDPIVEEGQFRLFERLGLKRLEAYAFNRYSQMVYLQVSTNDAMYKST